jgi:flagellar biosynthesis/type III secretory pathway M-ring protein FliF/YscJ
MVQKLKAEPGFNVQAAVLASKYPQETEALSKALGGVLKDNGIPFDVSADGTAVMVRYGNTAQARMLLAEKGLPQSSKSGYELFNDLGSLG